MSALRAGDTVIFKAVVTAVAPHDSGQQIMARIQPNGKEVGWCIPKENAFYPDVMVIKVGDMVKFADRPGHTDAWEVKAVFDNDQIAVQKRGNWPVEIANAKQARRIA